MGIFLSVKYGSLSILIGEHKETIMPKSITISTVTTDGGRTTEGFDFESADMDCGVRAFAIACGTSYKEAHQFCAKALHRIDGEGIYRIYTHQDNLEYAGKQLRLVDIDYSMTVREYMQKHPRSVFIGRIDWHLFAVRKGTLYDNGNHDAVLNADLDFALHVPQKQKRA